MKYYIRRGRRLRKFWEGWVRVERVGNTMGARNCTKDKFDILHDFVARCHYSNSNPKSSNSFITFLYSSIYSFVGLSVFIS